MTNIAFTIWPFIYFWKKEISTILYRDNLQENKCQMNCSEINLQYNVSLKIFYDSIY